MSVREIISSSHLIAIDHSNLSNSVQFFDWTFDSQGAGRRSSPPTAQGNWAKGSNFSWAHTLISGCLVRVSETVCSFLFKCLTTRTHIAF